MEECIGVSNCFLCVPKSSQRFPRYGWSHFACSHRQLKLWLPVYLGRPRKSWKDNIKEWTIQSMSSLLRVAEDRRRWAAVTQEASVGVPPTTPGRHGFDWLIDYVTHDCATRFHWEARKPNACGNVTVPLPEDYVSCPPQQSQSVCHGYDTLTIKSTCVYALLATTNIEQSFA